MFNGFFRNITFASDFPVTEALARSVLALPFSSTMTEDQVAYVCEHLETVLH